MKKLFLVLLAGALFVACGNKAEEVTEEPAIDSTVVEEVVVDTTVVEEVAEPVVEEKAAPAEKKTTVKQEVKKAGEKVAVEAVKVGEEKALNAVKGGKTEANEETKNSTQTMRKR